MAYLQPEERDRLAAELKERIANRKVISTRIAEARELGDLKENAEYHAAREDQGFNEEKIRQLESKLAGAIVVDTSDVPDDMVHLGSTVRLRDIKKGSDQLYRLVGEASGSFEADVLEVTATSPLGERLMRARIGEKLKIDLRRGPREFEVVEIVSR